jgi:biotin carboxyl carrier protein
VGGVRSARRPGRLRLTVGDAGVEVFQLGPDDLRHPVPGPEVRVVGVSEADRAAGIRRFETTIDGWVLVVAVQSEARASLRDRAGQVGATSRQHGPVVVRAPLPGRVVRLWVAEGDTVAAGQRLVAIEAMKMENEVRAPRDGTVASILVAADGSVDLGDELLTVR